MTCLETDFLIDILRKKGGALLKLEELEGRDERLSVSPISATEIFKGAFSSKKAENIEKAEELLFNLTLLEYDHFAAKEAGRLLDFLEKRGLQIGDLDTITAAICMRHGETEIVTKNERHYGKIAGLKISKW